MLTDKLALGIDTSNYKTSLAVVDSSGKILFNHQNFLEVKRGERGLRQSEALFQHVQNLPDVIGEALSDESIRKNIGVVSVSQKPRPIKGSYMPVFTAGYGFAKSVATALRVPLQTFSHQEGHIEAVKHYSSMAETQTLICFHFSGGTTEAILYDEFSNRFKLVGGSKDLAFGQVLDRVGVSLGYGFPCGDILDKIAVTEHNSVIVKANPLTKIKVFDGFINLSGIETQASRLVGAIDEKELCTALFIRLAEAILNMTLQLSEMYEIENFLYAGGVSCSQYIRKYLNDKIPDNIRIAFGDPTLSSDNAVGTALLGGKTIWR